MLPPKIEVSRAPGQVHPTPRAALSGVVGTPLASFELRLGPLNYLFSMAELHRWHHSKDLSLANANYGANLILWDIVFGTRKLPEGRHHQPEDVGFHGDETFPQTYLGQLGTLFRMPEPGPSIERHTSE